MKRTVSSRRFLGPHARAAGMVAALLAGLALAGCGLGPGEDTGDAGLLVTRDYGSKVLVDEPDLPVNESSTAMRLLDEQSDLETAYGGDYVQAVDGLSGDNKGGRSFDWFFAVNGIVAERGSAQFPISGGDQVWWDYRDWTDAMEVGAVVGSYPAPFATGYDNRDWGVQVDCQGEKAACDTVVKRLESDGVKLSDTGENMTIRVGTFDRLSSTDEGKRLQRGPAASGVFARFEPTTSASATGGDTVWQLVGLKIDGSAVPSFGPDAGLVAGFRRADDPPVWLITGGTDQAVRTAASVLNQTDLEHRYAAFAIDGRIGSLPLP